MGANGDRPLTADEILSGQRDAEDAHKRFGKRQNRLMRLAQKLMEDAGISNGRMLEIGGRQNPNAVFFPSMQHLNMDIAATGPDTVVGDITHCPEIESESFDFILSIDVFEHIDKPWLAARQIVRLLKPGGLTFHSTLFSWRYHACPEDYWRFTPSAMKLLFDGMQHVHAELDATERRRNITGTGKNFIEPDPFGGWRENWRVNYTGIKPS